ncbi:DGQHR domain-containing protein [Enterovirga rhinocerotis]|uniref:DGQHR domain-containing protein n=1 Tax=Enterovirga rhinocerotis TaxID=1339210 RepID=A0A4R7C8B1_9HYPH|nr:DGQHR domain-containing protein [Enterovirga rhinocerotis]TDR93535.1 DGQHR domain-containing protein [Enterovirga rhinocerotis]
MSADNLSLPLVDPDKKSFEFQALRATQPIGDLYLASVPHNVLGQIAYFDVRRVLQEERDVERYLGIQRPLNPQRVSEIGKYVNFADATFPSTVIIAISDEYASYDHTTKVMTVRNFREDEDRPSILIRQVARVLDGQHRIAGLYDFKRESFDVPVSIFIGSDISDQGYIFATVNLEQTKVSKSLAYDLFALAKTRSPQRTCHQIAVTLDTDKESPFFKKIKRLGFATPGRIGESITQATFVESLIRYISRDPKSDRDVLLRGGVLPRTAPDVAKSLIFREMFIAGRDVDIASIIFNYFKAVENKWPEGWKSTAPGLILNRASGFRALMRSLGPIYRSIAQPGNVPKVEKFFAALSPITFGHDRFNVEEYPPGSTGEGKLYRDFMSILRLDI